MIDLPQDATEAPSERRYLAGEFRGRKETRRQDAGAPSTRGLAQLGVEMVSGESTVTSSYATSPMKLLAPVSRGQSVWAFTSSFGGGLVAGDQTRLELQLGPGTRCFVGTQASTKVYRNPGGRPCGHVTAAMLKENGSLVFAPDPVQAFAGSTYAQRQEFHLAPGAGLALVDWFTSGRAARGERWEFSRFKSRTEVFLAGERIFMDSILLDSTDGLLTSPMRTGRFNCFALLLLAGKPMRNFVAKLLAAFASRPVERQAALVASASPVREGALLRLAGESVEQVGRELHQHLKPLAALLGDDPWARKNL
jgi:urease accessory protein